MDTHCRNLCSQQNQRPDGFELRNQENKGTTVPENQRNREPKNKGKRERVTKLQIYRVTVKYLHSYLVVLKRAMACSFMAVELFPHSFSTCPGVMEDRTVSSSACLILCSERKSTWILDIGSFSFAKNSYRSRGGNPWTGRRFGSSVRSISAPARNPGHGTTPCGILLKRLFCGWSLGWS